MALMPLGRPRLKRVRPVFFHPRHHLWRDRHTRLLHHHVVVCLALVPTVIHKGNDRIILYHVIGHRS